MLDSNPPRRLDQRSLRRAVSVVAEADPDLCAVVERHGVPPLWARRPGFVTLVRIILEQQVSLASGAAMFRRLEESLGSISAHSIRRCGFDGLTELGVTRQKASYCVGVAEAVIDGRLDFVRISRASADAARSELRSVRGIGPWTADVYLLMALRRPDVWPVGDIALQTAIQNLRCLPARPTSDEAAEEALRWAPWRAVAARILWHGYLSGSLRRPASNRTADDQRR